MVAVKTKKPAKARTLADMTVGELREVIRETVRDVLIEMSEEDFDPDEGLEFRPEVAEYLRKALREPQDGTPLEDVLHEMGIHDLDD